MPKTTRRRAAPSLPVAAAPAACPVSDASTNEAHPQRHVTLYGTARDLRRDGFRTGTQWSPVLRLSGRWLQQAGFDIGQRVRVRVDAGRLVIEPAG
jgi:toxic protein SymE